jgi:hypothetical protein
MEREAVIVPTQPPDGGGTRGVAFEVRRLVDGTEVLPVFSTVAALIRELGRYQPWVCVPMSAAREVADQAGAARVVRDPVLGADAWRWDPARLAAAGPGSGGPGRRGMGSYQRR